MLLDTEPKLEDIIVQTLALHPGSTVDDLYSKILNNYGKYSKPAIYQELRKLRQRTVCVHRSRKYYLRLGWILSLSELVDKMYKGNIKKSGYARLLPETGAKQIWNFKNLVMLGSFWTHLILELCEETGEKDYYEWAPHAWYHLCHNAEEDQFLTALKIEQIRYYIAIGSDTKFSRDYIRKISFLDGEAIFNKNIFNKNPHYFSLIGNYVITVTLPTVLKDKIDDMFQRQNHATSSALTFGLEIFSESHSGIKLTLENKPFKARRFKQSFMKYFG